MHVAVVIPALNEAESLPAVLRDLPSGMRVVVVDNGSTDGTAEVAHALGVEVVREPIRGYGRAVLAGIRHVQASPPDVLVILDADHADPPERVGDLIGPIAEGRADLVQADRTRTAEPGALTLTQRFGNWLSTILIARVSGHRYADMGPFRAIRWTALVALGMEDRSWGWNVEMQLKAIRYGLRVLEVPLPYRTRKKGRSKISGSLSGAVRAGIRILWAIYHYK